MTWSQNSLGPSRADSISKFSRANLKILTGKKFSRHGDFKHWLHDFRFFCFYYTVIGLEGQSPFFGAKIALEGQSRFLLRTKYFRGQIALEGQSPSQTLSF